MSENKKQGNRRIQIAFAVAVLIGAIIMLIAMERASRPEVPPAPPPATPQTGSTTTPPSSSAASPSQGAAPRPSAAPVVVEPGPTATRAFFASPAAPPPPPAERSPLADRLHASNTDGRADLTVVASLVSTFLDHFHEIPIGNNAEITAALAGDNGRGLAVLPADHPAINAQGELCDRWGTPFFFHQIDAGAMQVRSAGPDRRMHTTDDLVHPAAPAVAADFVP